MVEWFDGDGLRRFSLLVAETLLVEFDLCFNSGVRALAHEFVRELARHGALGTTFWILLAQERPLRAREVNALRERWEGPARAASQHVALVVLDDDRSAVCRYLEELFQEWAETAPTENHVYQCSRRSRPSRGNLEPVSGGEDLVPLRVRVLGPDVGESAGHGGKYVGGWPELIARGMDKSRSVTVISENTSEFLVGLDEPMPFFERGERHFMNMFSTLYGGNSVRLVCTYHRADLDAVAARLPTRSSLEAITRVALSHDELYFFEAGELMGPIGRAPQEGLVAK